MAVPEICAIPDCGKRCHAHGFCGVHYTRWKRHGDPLAGRTQRGEPMRYLMDVALPRDSEDCLPWPYAKNVAGYGSVQFEGRMQMVPRVICKIIHGPPPTPDHEAAHSCGKGHTGCCSGNHLSWKTHAGNLADKISHGTTNRGTRHPLVKLTETEIREVLSMKGTASQSAIGAQFGISQTHVGRIHRGERWGWLE